MTGANTGSYQNEFVALTKSLDSPKAREIAHEISSLSGLYCGPAVVGWIAAVWNGRKGRPYDYVTRLKDKTLFPDGPRSFSLNLPGFEKSLSELLRRETNNELQLSNETYFRYSTLHDSLRQFGMPVVLRMLAPKLRDGLHYTTLYKSEKSESNDGNDRFRLYWQDNGLTTDAHQRNSGLSVKESTTIGFQGMVLGAKRIVEV